jgi:hypothetical protein
VNVLTRHLELFSKTAVGGWDRGARQGTIIQFPHGSFSDFIGVNGLQSVLSNLNLKNRPTNGPWTEQLEIIVDVHVTARINDICRNAVLLAGTSTFLKCHAIFSINPKATGRANLLSVRTLPPPVGKTPNCP